MNSHVFKTVTSNLYQERELFYGHSTEINNFTAYSKCISSDLYMFRHPYFPQIQYPCPYFHFFVLASYSMDKIRTARAQWSELNFKCDCNDCS